MQRTNISSVSLHAAILGQLLAVAAAANEATAPQCYEYYLFDEPRPLMLDASRIALLAEDASLDTASLEAVGIYAASLAPWAHGWQLAEMPVAQRSADGVTRLLSDLTEESNAFVSPVFVDELGGPLIVTRDVLLRFEPGVAPDAAEHIIQKSGHFIVVERDWAGMQNAYRLRAIMSDGFAVLAAANALAVREDVRFAEPDFLFTGRASSGAFPDDALFVNQWGLHNVGQDIGDPCDFTGAVPDFDIDAPEAWKSTTGDPSIIIVIIDDGVQLDHPDLMIDPALGEDFTGEDSGGWPVNECDNHGTLVAGNAGALMNELGIVGVAPNCRLASGRPFISTTPPGGCDTGWTSHPSQTVECLHWAHEVIGARVTNNSNGYGVPSAAIEEKYEQTRESGMVHLASVGNDGISDITYPASLATVNGVAMVGPLGQLNSNSNYGEGLAFAAPGAVIVATDRTGKDGRDAGDYACDFGTSHASPHAAGVAALILSIDPSLSVDEVEQIMQESAMDMGDPGYDLMHGWGMVNAAEAVALAGLIPADLDGDGDVDFDDFSQLLASWGDPGCGGGLPCPADLDGDGDVDFDDFTTLLASWS